MDTAKPDLAKLRRQEESHRAQALVAALCGFPDIARRHAERVTEINREIATLSEPRRPHRRTHAPEGECKYCDEHRGVSFKPYHDPSPYCESGKHPHCTCDTCF